MGTSNFLILLLSISFVSCGERGLSLNFLKEAVVKPEFVSTWIVGDVGHGDGDNTITLPLRSGFNYDFEVDWGDGNVSQVTSYNDPLATHEYEAAGTYTVKMKGLAEAWHFDCSGDYEKFEGTVEFGDLGWKSLEKAFSCVTNIDFKATGKFLDLVNVKGMFLSVEDSTVKFQDFEAPALTSTENMFDSIYRVDMDFVNVSTASLVSTNLMFKWAYGFDLIIRNWDARNLDSATEMFLTVWNSTADIQDWHTPALSNMTGFLRESGDFDIIGNIDVSSVRNMSYLFSESGPISVDTSSWDLSSVTDMSYIFSEAYQLDIDTANWNTSNVTNMSYLFFDAYDLSINTVNWDTSNVEDISYFLKDANDIVVDISGWNTSNVENMAYAFANTNFSGDVAKLWDYSSATDMSFMFDSETLATPDYDSLLVQIQATATQPNVTFSAGSSRYTGSSPAETARTNLTSNGWVITDGGLAP